VDDIRGALFCLPDMPQISGLRRAARG